jgi:hypothetical protein
VVVEHFHLDHTVALLSKGRRIYTTTCDVTPIAPQATTRAAKTIAPKSCGRPSDSVERTVDLVSKPQLEAGAVQGSFSPRDLRYFSCTMPPVRWLSMVNTTLNNPKRWRRRGYDRVLDSGS